MVTGWGLVKIMFDNDSVIKPATKKAATNMLSLRTICF